MDGIRTIGSSKMQNLVEVTQFIHAYFPQMAEERHLDLHMNKPTQRLQEVDIGQLLVPGITGIDEERPPEREGPTRGDPRITIMTQQALREELREDVRAEFSSTSNSMRITIRPPDTLQHFIVLPQLDIYFLIVQRFSP